jgi:poly(hydroxyalkanoate) granule-associated protein
MAKKTKNVPTDVRESAHKIWLAGLGALSVAEDEGSKLFKRLVKEGEGFEKRGKDRIQKVQDTVETKVEDVRDAAETTWDRLGSNFDERVASTLKRLGVPSRLEIQRLTKRVEELTNKVDALKPKATPKPRATKKAASA